MPARSRRRPKRCVARPKSRKSSPSLATRPAAGQHRAGRPSCHGRPWPAASPSRDGESCPLANGQTSTVSGRRNAAVGLLVCFSATTEKNRRSPIEADPVMPLDRSRHARFAAGSAGETFTQAHQATAGLAPRSNLVILLDGYHRAVRFWRKSDAAITFADMCRRKRRSDVGIGPLCKGHHPCGYPAGN
jgi:hypothetical protein